jgi:hypothetical protein
VPLDPAVLAPRLRSDTVSTPTLVGEPGTALFHYTSRATALEYTLPGMSIGPVMRAAADRPG